MRSSGILAILILTLNCQPTLGLPEDTNLPIDIKAERQTLNKAKGELIYTGSVEIVQGSMKLLAEQVIRKSDENSEIITCVGNPVYFEVNTLEYGMVTGYANHVHYDRNNNKLTMTQDAKITQEDGSSTQSNKIYYDIGAEQLTFEGKPGERIETRLPPIRPKKDSADGDS